MPKLKKRMVLLFARPGTRASEVQLSVPDGQIDWTPELEARVTDSVTKILDPAAPPRIKAVGDAFHVAGTIQGEGETQIFLVMDDGAPVSLSVIRRPDEEPSWAVALGEIVDESARAPKPGTLLWYRLTCGLPQQLPARSVRTLPTLDAEAARRDYSYILSQLGACGRTRSRNN